MTIRKLVISATLIAAVGTIIFVGTLTDVKARLHNHYPSAKVAIHEGHSPGVHPVLSAMRFLRGSDFVPETEWIEVELTDEPKPVDLAKIFQFKVISIKMTRCIVNDISPVMRQRPGVYAQFASCDLTALPAEQRAALRVSPENPQRLTYGGP